jgi:Hemocyanin, all-alpha domain
MREHSLESESGGEIFVYKKARRVAVGYQLSVTVATDTMKAITLVTLVVIGLAGAYVVVPEKEIKYADTDFLMKQKAILEVFQHVHQKEVHTKLWTDAKTYKIEDNLDKYTNVTAVKEFVKLYKHGMLEFDEIFTILNEDLKTEAAALFDLFYFAKDWDTFYKTMLWAR